MENNKMSAEKLPMINSLIENNKKANDGLKTVRLILDSLSDLDLGKLMNELSHFINIHIESKHENLSADELEGKFSQNLQEFEANKIPFYELFQRTISLFSQPNKLDAGLIGNGYKKLEDEREEKQFKKFLKSIGKQDGDIINVITFDEFINYGLHHSDNIVDGMPWSFEFAGFQTTHENNRLYLIEGLGNFTPSDIIVERWNEEYEIIAQSQHPKAEQNRKEEWVSVEDRLPDSHTKVVLVYVKEQGVIDSNILNAQYFDDTNEWGVYDYETTTDLEVTHWKLPEPPSKELKRSVRGNVLVDQSEQGCEDKEEPPKNK